MNYSNIINSILNDKILSLEEKFILISLKNLDKYGDNIVTVGYETLMDYSSTTRRAKISSILKGLKEKGYIDWKRCGRKENEYRLIKDYLITEVGYGEIGEKYSSENGTLIKGNLYRNETFDNNNSFNNEKLEEFEGNINRTSDLNRYSENRIIENNSSNINRTFNYDASSKFGIITQNYDDKNGTTTSNHIYNINNKNNIYNKINNNTNIWVYKEIVDFWNSKNINRVDEISNKVIDDIRKAVIVYGVEKIKKGIENYSKVLQSNYYYNHEWNLDSFLLRVNGISRFLDDGDIWLKYKKQYETIDNQYEKCGMNYEDYINR